MESNASLSHHPIVEARAEEVKNRSNCGYWHSCINLNMGELQRSDANVTPLGTNPSSAFTNLASTLPSEAMTTAMREGLEGMMCTALRNLYQNRDNDPRWATTFPFTGRYELCIWKLACMNAVKSLVQRGEIRKLGLLWSHMFRHNILTSYYPLRHACVNGQARVVQEMLDRMEGWSEGVIDAKTVISQMMAERDRLGWNVMFHVCNSRNEMRARRIVDYLSDANGFDSESLEWVVDVAGRVPVSYALRHSHWKLAATLLENMQSGNVDRTTRPVLAQETLNELASLVINSEDEILFSMAFGDGWSNMVLPTDRLYNGRTPLHSVCARPGLCPKRTRLAELVVCSRWGLFHPDRPLSGISIKRDREFLCNQLDAWRLSPLMIVVERMHGTGFDDQDSQLIRFLLLMGADPNKVGREGESARSLAIKYRFISVVEILDRRGMSHEEMEREARVVARGGYQSWEFAKGALERLLQEVMQYKLNLEEIGRSVLHFPLEAYQEIPDEEEDEVDEETGYREARRVEDDDDGEDRDRGPWNTIERSVISFAIIEQDALIMERFNDADAVVAGGDALFRL